ncbi:MAG TPA: class I SAM-dependent methyltransferase [Stellaceae bacterium]|nr:class I SAM-dependent methyltransferase [Stellaceae bacterium]
MSLVAPADRSTDAFPSWIANYASDGGVSLISANRPYQFAEGEYDSYYGIDPSDEASGRGVVNLLRSCKADFDGPALELGCGSGKLTIGLCRSLAFPSYLITDGSQAFLDLTKAKLRDHGSLPANTRFATLMDEDMDRLPNASLSAIIIRSALHHFLDVPRFIRDAGATLRPGGALIFQEPCASGYLLMGMLSRFVVDAPADQLTPTQRQKAQQMADTMAAYNRVDLDKSAWEDKHLFRPEQIYDWAKAASLETQFFSNHEFEDFETDRVIKDRMVFDRFMGDYLCYCMGYGRKDADAIMVAAQPYADYVMQACSGTREPHLMGVFVLQRPR